MTLPSIISGNGVSGIGVNMSSSTAVQRGSKIFVIIIFILLGLTFLATTGAMMHEFWVDGWFAHLTLYSHLFLFFPTFGILALFAFYVPAIVFTDLYWMHVKPAGRFRFLFGFLVIAVVSAWLGWLIYGGRVPTLWQLSPAALSSDRGSPANCGKGARDCNRMSILGAVKLVREESQNRIGMAKFVRICELDPLLETPKSVSASRFCFASGRKMNASECCGAQNLFADRLAELYADPANRSLTGLVHGILLPFKAFFLLVLFAVGVLLAVWRKKVMAHYKALVPKIERGVIVGAFAVLFFPAANHGFLQSAAVTLGPYGGSIYPMLAPIVSIAFGAWTVFLVFFFFSRFEKDTVSLMRTLGFLASALAVFQYDEIIDYAVRFIGAGSDRIMVLVYVLLTVLGIGLLHRFGADNVTAETDKAS